jgi:hypothetical protein
MAPLVTLIQACWRHNTPTSFPFVPSFTKLTGRFGNTFVLKSCTIASAPPKGAMTSGTSRREQLEITHIVFCLEKGLQPPVATLSDVLGDTRDDDAGGTRHKKNI